MYLKHPKKRGFLSWDELGCLARALGFQSDIFDTYLPEELTKKEAGISIKHLYYLLDFFKYLNAALDRTTNIHTDEWNLHVLKKTVGLLDARVFSFGEVESIRMAYQVYESPDTKGLAIDEWVLMRALKMCGRTISPLKMMHRIKHMRNNFEEADRIQLHEFMDLLLWCEMYEGIEVKPKAMSRKKDERAMFKLEDFDTVLSHHDERLAARLNAEYLRQEWRFTKEKHSSKKMPKEIPPVDAEVRRKQVRVHQDRYAHLQAEVSRSQRRVFAARAGYVRPRPVSAPDLHQYGPPDDWSDASWTTAERPHTVYEITRHLYAPTPAKEEQPDIQEEVPRPKVTDFSRPKTPCAVTSDDITKMEHVREALQFEKETIDQKYDRLLEEDQDELLPGYRNRLANRAPRSPSPEPVPPRTPRTPRPTEDTLRRLSATKRPGPGTTHAKACDARFRGWYRTKARRGPHIILTGPTFDNSPTGRLLTKLHQYTKQQGQANDYAFRYTRRSDVEPSAALAFNTSVLCAGASKATSLATVAATTVSDLPSEAPIADGTHQGALNTTTDSGDSSRGLNTTRDSSDSRGTVASEVSSDVMVECPKPDDVSETKRKGRVEKKAKKTGTEVGEGISPSPLKEKAEERNKEKVIEIRKVGRIEVLAEISEKGEEEEDKQSAAHNKTNDSSGKSKQSRRDSTKSTKTPRGPSPVVESLDLTHRLSVPHVAPEPSMHSLSSRSDSISSVPLSREVSRLAKTGPEWLSEIIVARDDQPMISAGPANRRACRRLARRLGPDATSELRYRLLSSVG